MDKTSASPTRLVAATSCGLLVMWGLMASAAESPDAARRSIDVLSGTYGSNCGLPQGNASRELKHRCDGSETCSYELGNRSALEHAQQCRPDFIAEWRCGDLEFHTAALSSGAKPGDTLVLSCARATGAGK